MGGMTLKLEPEEAQKLNVLRAKMLVLREAAQLNGLRMFMGIPDYWYDSPHWRCTEGHVSTAYLKSEGLGRDACLACAAHVMLTFPEDKEGDLP